MARKKGIAVRCPDCGAFLDCGERCDCEQIAAERREAKRASQRRKLIEQNRRMMEQAFAEYDCC